MASNQTITYPHFYHNQVLKSSTLNGYFEFLDLQTRLSRVHLVGCGIVDGLTFSLKDGALVLSPGVAINKDGWLVEVREETEYRYVTEVDFSDEDFVSDNLEQLISLGGSRIKKICFQTEDDVRQFDNRLPEPISDLNLNQYVVALVLGKRGEYSSRCSQDSCNLNTTDQLLEVWPVLLEIGGVKSLFQKIAPMKFCVVPQKEPCISCYHGSVDSFNEQVLASVRLWVPEIVEVMTRLTNHLQRIPGTAWNGWFPYDSLMTRFAAATKMVQGLQDVKSAPDYYFSFFGDMAKALNEFIDVYNAFAVKYEVIPTRTLSDALVYLGCFDKSVQEGDDIYRSLFKNARADEARRDGDLLGRMLERICVLSEYFIKDEADSKLTDSPFRVMRARKSERLSLKPAPFYYDSLKDGFFEGWNPERLPLKEYGYLTVSASMNEEGWSLYPVAYQGKGLSLVKSELTSLNRSLRLSMDVVEVALNTGTSLKKKEADLLRKVFAPFAEKKDAKFVQKVKDNCHGAAFKLAELLEGTYDARLLDALQAGRPFTEEESSSFQGISELVPVDADSMTELAQAFLNGNGSGSAVNELSSAMTNFVSSWRGCFVSVGNGVSLEEFGKAVPLAPIRRGCRVFLITKPGEMAKADHIVISYSVFYRMHEETGIKVPEKVKPVLRMRSVTQVTGEYAVEFPDTVCPYGDNGKWHVDGNMISFVPYINSGASPAMYETSGNYIECQIADEEVLRQSRIDILEKKYPSLVLEMLKNDRTLVTIKVKDADGELLHVRSFYVEVDNPDWRVIPVERVSITPDNQEIFIKDKLKLNADVFPKNACKDVTWSADNPLVATVSKGGEVMAEKEGSVRVTAVSVLDKEKKATATVKVFSFLFRVKTVTKGDGDYLCDLPKAFNPFGDGGKWENDGNQITIVPYKFYGKNEKREYQAGEKNLICEVSDDSLVRYSIVTTGKSISSVVLKMPERNGEATVTLKLMKSGKEVHSQTFTLNVNNAKWQKSQIRAVRVDPERKEMFLNQLLKLKSIVTPGDASEEKITWRSEDSSIATVDSSTGEVTAIKEGTVRITATSEGGRKGTADLKISSIVFMMKTKEPQDNNSYAATFPDVVKLTRDSGIWDFTNECLRMYIKAYDGMVEKDLVIGESLISCTASSPKVLTKKIVSSPENTYVELYLKKGKSSVQISIKDPDGSDTIIYKRTFTVDRTF